MANPSTSLPIYERDDVVRYYESLGDLLTSETTILAALDGELSRMAVLDLGMGGGRTTVHLAPRALRYTGVDAAARMVEACIARFGEDAPRRTFRVGDARSMPMFEDGSFDLVFFSFNGIDQLAASERAQVFTEMRRVTRSGGHVVFSTHNLNTAVEDQFALRHATTWKGIIKKIIQKVYFHALNPTYRLMRRRLPIMRINDGAHWFALRQCYTRPELQVAQLRGLGYRDIAVLGLDGGRLRDEDLRSATDPWLYYWSRVK